MRWELNMLNYINNDDLIPNNSINQQSKIAGIDKKSVSKNPYSKIAEFGDTMEISDQAKKLYEQEKDVEKFKSMVMESLNAPQTEEEINSILDIIQSGDYVSNDNLAEQILGRENMFNPDSSAIQDLVEEL